MSMSIQLNTVTLLEMLEAIYKIHKWTQITETDISSAIDVLIWIILLL